jgi:trimethylamine monooxygenase
MTRVAVIGAGPAGLSQMRAFKAAEEKGFEVPEIVCFEKQSDWGGLWNYDGRTGTDAHGEPVHSGMYRNLWSNGPKECLELADYPFEDHFGKRIASYPTRPVLADYIKGRAEKSGIRPWVRFNTPVRKVSEDHTGAFTLTAHDLTNDILYSETFTHVVVATGHFSTPNVPVFNGLDTFQGRVLHSHDLRDVEEFRNQDVLVVGRSLSAEDVASQCYKFGAKSITISYRSAPVGYAWPENTNELPLLERVDGRTCTFKDGSTKDFDAIILCTGYLHEFPFMADGLRLKTENRFWPMGLYEGVVWESNPKVFYLGMQDQFYTFFLFDSQAWFVRDVIMGRVIVPSGEEMGAHSRKWKAKEEEAYATQDIVQLIWFQADYIKELVARSDYPLRPDEVEKTKQHGLEWKMHKDGDIMGFRDQVFRSVVTGNMGRQYHTPWLTALDDSLESYVT